MPDFALMRLAMIPSSRGCVEGCCEGKVLGDLLGGETESVKRGIKSPFLITQPVK